MIHRPMLAARCPEIWRLRYPLLATPKIDGVRCYVAGGIARTRSGAPVPNPFIRRWIEAHLPEGTDGELQAGPDSRSTCSAVLSRGEPNGWVFHAFDLAADPTEPYTDRHRRLEGLEPAGHLHILPAVPVRDVAGLIEIELAWAGAGHEGIVLRDPLGTYTPGRCRARSQGMLKIRWGDDGDDTGRPGFDLDPG